MEFPFPINRLAVGSDFLTRGIEAEALASNITDSRHTLIFDSKKTGKHSLVRNALNILDRNGCEYSMLYVDFFKCRSEDALVTRYADAVRKTFSSYEFAEDVNPYLTVSKEMSTVVSIPETIASEKGTKIIVWLDEFQNILNFDDPDHTLKLLEQCILSHSHITYIFMGSKINAMNYILERLGSFLNFCGRINLPPLSEDDVTYHISRVFQKVGRIITKNQTKQIYDYAQANPWLIWQIANTCFNLTRGYVTEDVIQASVNVIMESHEMEFHEIIDSLSNYQLRLLKAVFDGEVRLNSQDVIDKYNLSSSANVHRLKEALLKKEVITFDDDYRPRIIDPLFHLWLKTCYFTK